MSQPIFKKMKELYARSGINSSLSESINGRSILFVLEALKGLFDAHFDNGWLLNILDKLSFSPSVLRDIRIMIHLSSINDGDLSKLEAGLEGLEEYITFTHRCVLPVLREELGISGFYRFSSGSPDETTAVLKGFFLYTFPHNLERLTDLYTQLVPLVAALKGSELNTRVYPRIRAVQ